MKRIERSTASTSLVMSPTEMKSTPVSATARILSRRMPPEASSAARQVVRRTAWRSWSSEKLSSNIRPTPAASACCNSARFSTSTSSGAVGVRRRAPATAAAIEPAAATWFFLRVSLARLLFGVASPPRAGAGHGLNVAARAAGGPGQSLQKIERGALAGEQAAGGAIQLAECLRWPHRRAVPYLPHDFYVRLDLAKHFVEPSSAADHRRFAADHTGMGMGFSGDEGGREIAAADVFTQGSDDVGADVLQRRQSQRSVRNVDHLRARVDGERECRRSGSGKGRPKRRRAPEGASQYGGKLSPPHIEAQGRYRQQQGPAPVDAAAFAGEIAGDASATDVVAGAR